MLAKFKPDVYDIRKSVFLISSNNRIGSFFKVRCCLKRENPAIIFLFKVCPAWTLQAGTNEFFITGSALSGFYRSPVDY